MSRKKQVVRKETANVEFGVEFGDLNASKMFERPFPKKKTKDKK
ncbi:hypothetical protein [Mesobacillus maritimus]|nr:hypothetical protein [Mesobacillus maritimus]